ncbi:OmpA family protein [Candidatus Halobeggiatoa sp. HSG11]|nr:OmpA family protein [Candidatus Halobeggiatoa sp. HSG11]
MFNDDAESNVSWIGFSDLFFHLFIFFFIVFIVVKISAMEAIKNNNLYTAQLEQEYNQEIDYLNIQIKALEAKLAACMEKVAICEFSTQQMSDDKTELQLQIKILETKLQSCQSNLQECQISLNAYQEDNKKLKYRLRKYKNLVKYEGYGPDTSKVETNKIELFQQIAMNYNFVATEDERCIPILEDDSLCVEDTTLQEQTISFGSSVLFTSGRAKLKVRGRDILTTVGNVIRNKLPVIQEIQIQGHADTTAPRQYDIDSQQSQKYNLKLASERALEVFLFLKEQLAINPAEVLMSATSFGSYKPVTRTAEDKYTWERIRLENDDDDKKQLNRRIEIVLTYRR